VLSASAPEYRDGSSEDGWIAFAGNQIGGRSPSPVIGRPRKQSAVCANIGRVDKKRLRKVGQRSFLESKPPGGCCAENVAMSGGWGGDPGASIRVFKRRGKVPSSQCLRCQAFERDM
jgi:hypothetical protein